MGKEGPVHGRGHGVESQRYAEKRKNAQCTRTASVAFGVLMGPIQTASTGHAIIVPGMCNVVELDTRLGT